MKHKLLISLFVMFAVFIGAAESANAAWPGSSANPIGPTEATMAVERIIFGSSNTEVHSEMETYFAGYMQGDSRGAGVSFTMTLVQTSFCNMSNEPGSTIRLRIEHPGNPGGEYHGSCANRTIWMQYNNGEYDAAKNVTIYRVRVVLEMGGYTGDTSKGYRFQVTGPAGMLFGNQGRDGAGNFRPFVFMPGGAQGSFADYSFVQQPQCTAGSTSANIESRDYDNFNGSRAQSTNTTNASGNGASGVFSAMGVSLRPAGGGYMSADGFWHQVSGGTAWGFWNGNAGIYYPPDTASDQFAAINYNYPHGNNYIYTLHNFGQNNFARLDLPFDANPFICSRATITAGASGLQTIDGNDGGSVTLTNTVSTSNVQNAAGATFNWATAISGVAGPTWTNGVVSGTANIDPAGVPVNSGATISIPLNSPSYIGQEFCRSITVSGVPIWAQPVGNNGAQACVRITGSNIVPVTQINGVASDADHEIGSGDKTSRHGIANGSIVCTGAAVGSAINVDVYRQFDADAPVLVATVTMNNCQTYGGYLSPAPGVPISGAFLDAKGPGGSYPVKTIVVFGARTFETPRNIRVYSVPFTQFYGNDVRVCESGATNRFVYRDLTADNSRKMGSYAEYATIYRANNTPGSAFSGLNSAANRISTGPAPTFPLALASNWSTQTCVNGPTEFTNSANTTTTTISGNFNAKITYNITGNVTINGNITTGGPNKTTSPFRPELYPVVLIRATGNINITNNVNNIEAVLVADGSINTCYGVQQNQLHLEPPVGCRTPLRIDGAMIADTIRLQRSSGTRLNATMPSINPLLTPNNTAFGAAPTSAAEIVEYPWYLHFVTLDLPDKSQGQFNSYFSMPPRL